MQDGCKAVDCTDAPTLFAVLQEASLSEAAQALVAYVNEQLRDLQAQVPAFLAAVGGADAGEGDELAAGEPLTPPQVCVCFCAS